MAVNSSKKLFRGAVLLAAASVFVKVLSAVYRIPYQNIAGDVGFYIYQQVYPFYGIAVALSSIGFPMAISKMVAERHFSKLTLKEIMVTSLCVLSMISVLIFLALYFGADLIAEQMGDDGLAQLVRITAFSFLLMPVISVIRGYYQGFYDMVPTAASQIFEQLVRVVAILLFAFILIEHGFSLYQGGAGAVLGSVIGGLTGVLVLVSFMWFRKDWSQMMKSGFRAGSISIVTKTIFIHGLTFCITSLILVLFQLVDSMNLFMLLRKSGLTEFRAKEWKGIFDRGQPLIQLGTVVSNSISLTLVPLVSGYIKKRKNNEVDHMIKMVLLISLAIGTAASIGLICIMEPVNYMLFTDTEGSSTLAVLSVSILFTCLIMAQASILQSMGYTLQTVLIVLVGITAKWFLNLVLVPHFQIMGAAIATVIGFCLMSLLFFLVLITRVSRPLFEKRKLSILMVAAMIMAAALLIFNGLVYGITGESGSNRILATIQALASVSLGGLLFIAVIVHRGMFTNNELNMVPFGDRLAFLLPKTKS
ncbi:putative polysaccharide biosynthesis protein [Peribacillus glennii]|uniref:Polysaccharide biosynthesis protein n=1 Tax=Peribacillus glennii TaxID=2303991 RepID=A0A372LAJ6_9BACI|nr:polysaccharide biosynthesis protein [Peribacillus glennii]RFU62649.1 polysaccharide biosynthesis protein [Peribacillus glennii]